MVPNIFHFVFGMQPDFGGKPFSLVHYLSVKSAFEVNRPERIYLHYQYEPQGEWWGKTKSYLTLNKIVAPIEIFGNPLCHVAHQADIVRLMVLKEIGGVYLDMDTISIKPLRDFFHYKFAMGKELRPPIFYTYWDKIKKSILTLSANPFKKDQPIYGLCNAALLSEPNSEFINIWLQSYRTFRSKGKDEYWIEHSVKIPYELAHQHPDKITLLSPYFFHYPLYDKKGLSWLFKRKGHFPIAYIYHLWETLAWDKYLSKLSLQDIKKVDTTYNDIARQFL